MIRNSEKLGGLLGKYFLKATYNLACVRMSAVMWIPPLASQDHPIQGPVSACGRVRGKHIFLMLHLGLTLKALSWSPKKEPSSLLHAEAGKYGFYKMWLPGET